MSRKPPTIDAVSDAEVNPALVAARQAVADPVVLAYIFWLLAWTMTEETDQAWEEAKRLRRERLLLYRTRLHCEWVD